MSFDELAARTRARRPKTTVVVVAEEGCVQQAKLSSASKRLKRLRKHAERQPGHLFVGMRQPCL